MSLHVYRPLVPPMTLPDGKREVDASGKATLFREAFFSPPEADLSDIDNHDYPQLITTQELLF